ncbi:transposase [uncultured Intestinimonas sp.]|nr:transposase [uncultured Intestinimonas sp.]
MPNHVHMILVLTSQGGRTLCAPTVSRVIKQFKGVVTKRAGLPLWQKSFHDHIIRNEADYLRIWQYIDTNPLKWREDCFCAPA